MQIVCGHFDRGVSEELLYIAQVGSIAEKVRCTPVAQGMGLDGLIITQSSGCFYGFDQACDSVQVKTPTPVYRKQILALAVSLP